MRPTVAIWAKAGDPSRMVRTTVRKALDMIRFNVGRPEFLKMAPRPRSLRISRRPSARGNFSPNNSIQMGLRSPDGICSRSRQIRQIARSAISAACALSRNSRWVSQCIFVWFLSRQLKWFASGHPHFHPTVLRRQLCSQYQDNGADVSPDHQSDH